MLISRAELSFDFKGAKFEHSDSAFLGWVFNQFLYGEVTGIQCGYWLYKAPHLNAASFLAKQAGEELSHVRKILRILTILGQTPAPAHPAIRFMSTGMMGGSWGEHVVLEMALGEGLVLNVFYALADTIDQPEIKKILESALEEEEGHVRFGEKEAAAWLEKYPQDRRFLFAQCILQLMAMKLLKRFILKMAYKTVNPGHPVLSQFGAFYEHLIRRFEKRIELLGLSQVPVSQISIVKQIFLVMSIPLSKIRRRFLGKTSLTETYLQDPVVLAELKRK